MALLTDGSPNNTENLRVYEASILNVASVETIDLATKLDLATEEISQEILDVLLSQGAVNDPQGSQRRAVGVADVVVTPQVKRWHALHTLKVVYRDAYNNQLNDRYRAKWAEYRDLAREAKDRAIRYGIGLVSSAVPKADVPVLGSIAGTTPATLYYVRVSWLGATGQEGRPSDATAFSAPDGSSLTVRAVNAPNGASGWNVYIGTVDGQLFRQNLTTLALTDLFTLNAGPLAAGAAPGDGQAPDVYVTGGTLLRRG
jgi:hypothetical protein